MGSPDTDCHRADLRPRRTSAAVVAATAALLAVVTGCAPARSSGTSSSSHSPAVQSALDDAPFDDTARWGDPPPFVPGASLLQAVDLDDALPGPTAWTYATVDMQPAWLRRACTRGPMGDDGLPTAGAGPAPRDQVTQAWIRQDSSGFTTTEALRWDGADAGGAAAAWVRDVADEAARCEGAVVVAYGHPAAVVVVRPWDQVASGAPGPDPQPVWSATALVARGTTALEVDLGGLRTPTVEEAGRSAVALLERTAARVLAADDAVRASGVDDADLTSFTEVDPWDSLPPLHTVGPPPEVPLMTEEDLAVAFPGAPSWEGQPQPAIGGRWLRSWCDDGRSLPVDLAQPAEVGPLFEASGGPLDGAVVDAEVLRWPLPGTSSPDPWSAYTWTSTVGADALSCPGARPAATGGLPGSAPSAAVTPDGDGWRVQVVTVGGPTAVRVRVTLPSGSSADADTTATSAVALARRVVANVVLADASPQPGRP